jgi:transposase InsO family protein
VLDDAGVLASVGSTGDAYDNALAESFVDSVKTELIADRAWRTPQPARTRDRRVRRLVQHQPPARFPRRPLTGRVRGSTRSAVRAIHTHTIKI